MARCRRSFVIAILVAGGLLAPSRPSAAQSYGLGDQVLALGAPAFHPTDSTATYFLNIPDGYLYGEASYMAPLILPDGAEIFQMCVYGQVFDANATVSSSLWWIKQVPGGGSPGTNYVPGSLIVDNIPIGYGTVCTGPGFSYVFHDYADVDGDQIPENIAHFLYTNSFTTSGFGGVRIWWRRQVSPPPGTPTFGDVPLSDTARPFVEALVAAGITAGCGGGNYCPDAPLTRRQMAVFLAKALGLHWPN